MKSGERLKLSSNLPNIYQIACVPKAIKYVKTGEEELLPFQLL